MVTDQYQPCSNTDEYLRLWERQLVYSDKNKNKVRYSFSWLQITRHAHMLRPLSWPLLYSLPSHDTFTIWRQKWSPEWSLLSQCCHPSFLNVSLYFTSQASLFAAAQSIRDHFYLPHYMCLPGPYLPLHAAPLSLTVWGCGFEAVMTQSRFFLLPIAGKCVLRWAISLRSPDFPCLAALIHMTSGRLFQQSWVSAEGAGRSSRCHSLLSVICRGSLTTAQHCHLLYPKNQEVCIRVRKHLPHSRFYGVWPEDRQLWVAPLMNCGHLARFVGLN